MFGVPAQSNILNDLFPPSDYDYDDDSAQSKAKEVYSPNNPPKPRWPQASLDQVMMIIRYYNLCNSLSPSCLLFTPCFYPIFFLMWILELMMTVMMIALVMMKAIINDDDS